MNYLVIVFVTYLTLRFKNRESESILVKEGYSFITKYPIEPLPMKFPYHRFIS